MRGAAVQLITSVAGSRARGARRVGGLWGSSAVLCLGRTLMASSSEMGWEWDISLPSPVSLESAAGSSANLKEDGKTTGTTLIDCFICSFSADYRQRTLHAASMLAPSRALRAWRALSVARSLATKSSSAEVVQWPESRYVNALHPDLVALLERIKAGSWGRGLFGSRVAGIAVVASKRLAVQPLLACTCTAAAGGRRRPAACAGCGAAALQPDSAAAAGHGPQGTSAAASCQLPCSCPPGVAPPGCHVAGPCAGWRCLVLSKLRSDSWPLLCLPAGAAVQREAGQGALSGGAAGGRGGPAGACSTPAAPAATCCMAALLHAPARRLPPGRASDTSAPPNLSPTLPLHPAPRRPSPPS